jgi:hypothetical protein
MRGCLSVDQSRKGQISAAWKSDTLLKPPTAAMQRQAQFM